MARERAVIHLNIADFAARVEACLTPSLREAPLIIAPQEAPRAVVFDMSEQAFQEGIRKGMPLARARKLHPGIPVLPPRFRHYRLVMRDILKQARTFSPAIESGETDGHLFLDITGTGRLYGPPPDVAFRLRKNIARHLGLSPIWTLATNKLVAKVASRVVKPTGEYIVGPGDEASFLGPLPIHLLPGLTQTELTIMTRFNLAMISQARALTPAQLAVPFDGRAPRIHSLLQGIDNSPVGSSRCSAPESPPEREVARQSGKIRAFHEFADDTNDAGTLKAGLALALARLCRSLGAETLRAKSLDICLTYSDGRTSSRSGKISGDNDLAMLPRAWALFSAAWTRRTRIRRIALSCTPVLSQPVQAGLFPDTAGQGKKGLAMAMHQVRERFGTLAVRSGAALAADARPC